MDANASGSGSEPVQASLFETQGLRSMLTIVRLSGVTGSRAIVSFPPVDRVLSADTKNARPLGSPAALSFSTVVTSDFLRKRPCFFGLG